MKVLKRLFWRLQYERSKRVKTDRISVFNHQKAAAGFFRFNDYLTQKTSTRLEPLYLLRLHEIDKMVRQYNVQSVCEMGTGRTTYFFNLYPDLKVFSYEQDQTWRDTLLKFFIDEKLPLPQIHCTDVEYYKKGGRYSVFKDQQYDLLYIDGPYVLRKESKFDTYTGKPAYYDFERVLAAGLPKVIMIEGRTDTVDEILASPYLEQYDFCGELTWALERNQFLHAFRLSRHSIFIRKQ